ncbi:hypothetical protein C8R45DRAFT_1112296 [Mycena sanguinolenta]|nr:hypothetical protein C8R45DRAFT_1112296 [Mycena sanguinolenta]
MFDPLGPGVILLLLLLAFLPSVFLHSFSRRLNSTASIHPPAAVRPTDSTMLHLSLSSRMTAAVRVISRGYLYLPVVSFSAATLVFPSFYVPLLAFFLCALTHV